MASVAIRDELLQKVAAMAKARGVPLERQAEELLRESLARHAPADELKALLESVAAMTPNGVAQVDSLELLRQDRDR